MELGLLNCLKSLNIKNPLPAPILLGTFKDQKLVLDGVKRIPDGATNKTNEFIYLTEYIIEKEEDQLKYWLDLNLKHRIITDGEYILLLKTTSLFDFFMKYLNSRVIDEYKKCFNFENNILKYLVLNSVPKNILKYIYTCAEEIRSSVNDILISYEINASNLKNLIEFSNDIFIKTELNILKSNNFIKLLNDSGISTAIDFVHKTRFEKLELKRNKILKAQNLIKNKKLKTSFDSSFEKSGISLNILLENQTDIYNLETVISENKSCLEDILKTYNE